MAKLQALWVHGSSVQIEREGYFISKQRAGFGTILRTHGKEWFHFAIPTPVYLEGESSELTKVFILFKTEGTAMITAMHVYDGSKKVHGVEPIDFKGDHSTQLDNCNTWALPAVHINYGLGISVQVDFGPPSTVGVPSIQFVSAGADFKTP
jgi:hypothetical protein